MKKIVLSIGLFICIYTIHAQETTWTPDRTHSEVLFVVTHMVISEVTGSFQDFNVEVISKKDDFSGSVINFSAKVSSINTNSEKRDQHLQSGDFFDEANYPEIVFHGKSFKKISDRNYKLVGDLTMKGVTREVALDVDYKGTIKGPWGNTRAGFKIKGKLNRFDYGLKWNKAIEAGGLVVGEDVDIICNIELIKK